MMEGFRSRVTITIGETYIYIYYNRRTRYQPYNTVRAYRYTRSADCYLFHTTANILRRQRKTFEIRENATKFDS